MANTLLMRQALPFLLQSRARLLLRVLPFSLQSNQGSVSHIGAVLCSAEENRSKLQFHSDATSQLSPRYWESKLEGRVLGRRFSSRATSVDDAGFTDSPLTRSMEMKIKEQLSAESVSVKDASGDGRHVCIDVISSTFEGQSAVNRQRMVYKAIWEELQSTVHAVDQMTTRTPTEAGREK